MCTRAKEKRKKRAKRKHKGTTMRARCTPLAFSLWYHDVTGQKEKEKEGDMYTREKQREEDTNTRGEPREQDIYTEGENKESETHTQGEKKESKRHTCCFLFVVSRKACYDSNMLVCV